MRFLFFLLAPQILGPILTDRPSAVSYYCRTITIDHTKVPSTQTDFPVLVSGTYSYLADEAHSGKVKNSNGYDVRFYPSSDCSGTKLDHEVELYTAATGAVIYWMKVSSVSSSSDTVISMRYGEAGITTDQSNPTGVWDANHKGVWHLKTSLTLTDSTSNGYTLTNNGTVVSATGQIGGGASTTAASSQYLTAALDASSGGLNFTNYTISFWAKPSSAVSSYGLFQWANAGSPQSGGPSVYFRNNDTSGGQVTLYTDPGAYVISGVTAAYDVWHLFTLAFDGSNFHVYVDDAEPSSAAAGTWTTSNANVAYFGSGFAGYATALYDEMRISNSARSLNWTKTSYYNQNSPSTFYAVGSEVAH